MKRCWSYWVGFPSHMEDTHICQTQQSSFDIGIFVFWYWVFLRIPKWIHFSEYKVRRVLSMILREKKRREREKEEEIEECERVIFIYVIHLHDLWSI